MTVALMPWGIVVNSVTSGCHEQFAYAVIADLFLTRKQIVAMFGPAILYIPRRVFDSEADYQAVYSELVRLRTEGGQASPPPPAAVLQEDQTVLRAFAVDRIAAHASLRRRLS